MAGDAGQLPPLVATGDVQATTRPGPPATMVEREADATTVSALGGPDLVQAGSHPTGPTLVEVHFDDGPKPTPTPTTEPASDDPETPPLHETAHAVDANPASDLAAEIIQQAKDTISKAMNDMMDASIESQRKMMQEAEAHHRKVDPIKHAEAQKSEQQLAIKIKQSDEIGLEAAEKRRIAP